MATKKNVLSHGEVVKKVEAIISEMPRFSDLNLFDLEFRTDLIKCIEQRLFLADLVAGNSCKIAFAAPVRNQNPSAKERAGFFQKKYGKRIRRDQDMFGEDADGRTLIEEKVFKSCMVKKSKARNQPYYRDNSRIAAFLKDFKFQIEKLDDKIPAPSARYDAFKKQMLEVLTNVLDWRIGLDLNQVGRKKSFISKSDVRTLLKNAGEVRKRNL